MRRSVREAFVPFTERFEGKVPFMYLDVRGLVTTAIGNLVDPVEMALDVPFVTKAGHPATQDEIVDDWNRVKARANATQHPNPKSGGVAFGGVAELRLTEAGIDFVVQRKLSEMDRYLSRRFPMFEAWSADAQLATLSMAWACGPAFHFPKLEAALRVQDFASAALECHIDTTDNLGVIPRNDANRRLYRNAAFLHEHPEYGIEPLFYPRQLSREFANILRTPTVPVPAIPYSHHVEGVLEQGEQARRRDRDRDRDSEPNSR
jgi:GH24 family phage-related lysozyme (muramidase)